MPLYKINNAPLHKLILTNHTKQQSLTFVVQVKAIALII